MPRIHGRAEPAHEQIEANLYARHADIYTDAGFTPTAVHGKKSPFTGTTGNEGAVTPEIDAEMRRSKWHNNIAIRHDDDTIAIDVDQGDGKRGAETIAALEEVLGPLPATFSSTSRGADDPRRQYFFRKSAHITLISNLVPGRMIGGRTLTTGGVELPQRRHRYSVVWPSEHPDTGKTYIWYDLDGKPMDGPPRKEELTPLPSNWEAALAKDAVRATGAPVGAKKLSLEQLLANPPKRGNGETNTWLTTVAGHYAARHRNNFETYASLVRDAAALVDPEYEDTPTIIESVWQADQRNHPDESPLSVGGDVSEELDPAALEPEIDSRSLLEGMEDFWDARPVLKRILQAAQNRLVSPWAVLASGVAHTLASVPPHVVLPPIVGGKASLNTYVTLVAGSGGGKDAAGAVARELFTVHSDTSAREDALGSGEGLTKAYAHYEKGLGVVMDHTNVLFTLSEIDNLTALSARQGSTLIGTLREAWTGSRLGFGYGDPTKKVILQGHSYRMCLLVYAQPGRAASLFDDADGGTPQRFIWLPAFGDLGLTSPDERPAWPAEIEIKLPWSLEDGVSEREVVLTVPKVAESLIVRARFEMVNRGSTSLDGHALLARLKFAYGLALIDNRLEMNDADWHLAGRVMEVSNRTRSWMQSQVEQTRRSEAVRQGELRGAMNEAAQAVTATARVKRIKDGIVRRLKERGPMSKSNLRRSVAQRDRDLFDQVLEHLIKGGDLVQEAAAHGGVRYTLRDSQ